MTLKGDVAVITGASRGIGLAIAERFAAEGARLAITSRHGPTLDVAARLLERAGAQVFAMPTDVTDSVHVRRFADAVLERFGRVDILVNNAGSAKSESFLRTDRALWEEMLAVNATSTFLVTRAFLPAMLKQGGGRIVMISSISGKRGAPYIAAYSAAKHAQLGLVRSLAEEFRAKNIVVNAVCPHYVDTPMTARSIENIVQRTRRSAEDARALLGGMNPQGRLITPQEVAAKALDFALSTCKVTGEALDL